VRTLYWNKPVRTVLTPKQIAISMNGDADIFESLRLQDETLGRQVGAVKTFCGRRATDWTSPLAQWLLLSRRRVRRHGPAFRS
jgi:hypothetical protein